MSARYGDTSGIGPNSLPGIIQAGGASRTGGFHTGDRDDGNGGAFMSMHAER